MKKQKALLIINPISGTGKKEGLAEKVADVLKESDIAVDHVLTKCAGDATNIARKAVDDGYDIVIAAGGDGTINETAIGLCGTDVVLGIIPCGSGNGLARHLNIPVDVHESIKIIASGQKLCVDYGTVVDRPFFCTFGVGFDAAVSHKFAQSKHRGKMTYIKNTFHEYLSFKPEEYVIKANDEVITDRAFVVAVCNASQYGNNAYIAPHASITDGLLDVTIIHYGNILTTALVGLDLMAGTIEKNMLIHTFRTDRLTLERKTEGPAHIDGEPVMLPARLDVVCNKQQLNVFSPGEKDYIHPITTPVSEMFNDTTRTVKSWFR